VDFETREHPRAANKPSKKFVHIVPRLSQVVIDEHASGLVTLSPSGLERATSAYGHEIQLGLEEDSIWDNRFKIRFTSRSTGRKFDLNLIYKYKKATEVEDPPTLTCEQTETKASFQYEELPEEERNIWEAILDLGAEI
jgi:hypothetical protein